MGQTNVLHTHVLKAPVHPDPQPSSGKQADSAESATRRKCPVLQKGPGPSPPTSCRSLGPREPACWGVATACGGPEEAPCPRGPDLLQGVWPPSVDAIPARPSSRLPSPFANVLEEGVGPALLPDIAGGSRGQRNACAAHWPHSPRSGNGFWDVGTETTRGGAVPLRERPVPGLWPRHPGPQRLLRPARR